jgi:hypothetical protein
MGFFFTFVYISFALLSPQTLFPGYRVELGVGILALLFSVPGLFLERHRFYRTPQVYLLAGMIPAVFLSQAIGGHWFGGGVLAVAQFLPSALAFYLIVLNCPTLTRLKFLASALAAIAAFFVLQGARAYYASDLSSIFLTTMGSEAEPILRIRGLGFLNDPNELAQFFVVIIPLFWLLWRNGRIFRSILLVILPTAFFIWGIYLTHSRGAIVALFVIFLLGLKDRLGIVGSLLATAVLCAALLVMNISGGREVSMAAGADRMAFWGTGLQLFKAFPLFGVGLGNFPEWNAGHTAHNTFVQCLAEIGLLGYTLWMGLLIFTIAGLHACLAALKPRPKEAPLAARVNSAGTFPVITTQLARPGPVEATSADIYRWATMLRISLAGFLTAAWFLSRAYVLTLYLILGMSVTLLWLVPKEKEAAAAQPLSRLLALTAELEFAPIVFVYLCLRARVFF